MPTVEGRCQLGRRPETLFRGWRLLLSVNDIDLGITIDIGKRNSEGSGVVAPLNIWV